MMQGLFKAFKMKGSGKLPGGRPNFLLEKLLKIKKPTRGIY